MLATGGAAFWSRVLQIELAGNNSNPELARFAAELNELAARAFTSISPVVMDGDMAGLERILDESADTLTGLANAVRRLTLTMESG